jgi:hypothetical protein
MTDAATARYGARQQSQGSNTNTWGDDKLNEVLRLFDRGSKGVQTLVMTGDQTLSWSNYVATNTGQCAVLLLTGSLSSAAALVVPGIEWQWQVIKNSTGQAVTVKTAAGTGISIPNGRALPVYCDATECYNSMGSNIPTAASIAGALTVAGQISGVIAGTAATDAVNKTQMETAIAAAGLPATSGTILNSSVDMTAGYLAQKFTAATGGGLSFVTSNPGVNESLAGSLDVNGLTGTTNVAAADTFPVYDATSAAIRKQTRALLVGKYGLILQSDQMGDFTATVGGFWPCDTTSNSFTMTFPATPTRGDIFAVTKFGEGALTFLLNSSTFYGSSTPPPTISNEGVSFFYYSGATRGWIDL